MLRLFWWQVRILSHYLSYDDAVKKDKDTIDMILRFDNENLYKKSNSACGKIPIMTLVSFASLKG